MHIMTPTFRIYMVCFCLSYFGCDDEDYSTEIHHTESSHGGDLGNHRGDLGNMGDMENMGNMEDMEVEGDDEDMSLMALTTAEVFTRLLPQCASCHGINTQDPYFADLERFQHLLVDNREYIVGGSPDESVLIDLLNGTNPGAFQQMPPFEESFKELENLGQTQITIAEIELWISTLPINEDQPLDCTQPQPGRAPLRRLTSTEYKFAVQDLLGIEIDPTEGFPAEEEVLGFDNNADALTVTRLLAEKYFEAGERAAETALINPLILLEHVGLPCRMARLDCVRELAQTLAYQAYRRPLEEGELDRLLVLFNVGDQQLGDFLEGVKLVIAGILQSPHFLYRIEFGEEPVEGELRRALSDYEIATRLSFFLWVSMPDIELFEVAERGELHTKEQIAQQARRMIEDPKARRAVRHFYKQWLNLTRLPETEKLLRQFPNWSPAIAEAMIQEVTMLAEHLTWTIDGEISDLFKTQTSFLTQQLANFYSFEGVEGAGLTQIEFDSTQRSGILTRGGVMAAHAKSDQGSPIIRGVFVREKVLCQQLPNPPDDVDNSPPELDPNATTRDRFAAHTEIESCATCHQLIDPVGFTFEAYDAVGRYRTTENGLMIDTQGELIDAGDLNGEYINAQAMSNAFAQSEMVHQCVIRQWFRYTNGRIENAKDECSINQVWNEISTQNFRLKDLLIAMTQTDAFLYRPLEGGE
jgi:hypothetical protein